MTSECPVLPDSPIIEFLCEPGLLGHIPAPARATRFMPDWFRRLDREMRDGDISKRTIKACMPVADVFSLGYILPLPFDLRIHVLENGHTVETEWAEDLPFTPIEPHHPGQIGAPAAPFETAVPMKFVNPWRIKVAHGYSVLFTPVLSRPELPFTPFSGLVDCDRFDTTVNIPFVWTGPTGTHELPAGMPIAQCVPLKRDALIKKHIARAANAEELAEQAAANERKYDEQGAYTRDWRVPK